MPAQPETYQDMPSYSNLTRPELSLLAPGTPIWNTDDNCPQWTDGENWRDSKGHLT